jgi:hypothetical protein
VRPLSTDGIKAFVCKYSSGWTYGINTSITIPLSNSTNDLIYYTYSAVGNDNYIYISSPYANGTYTNGGQLTAAYYNGTSWVTDSTLIGTGATVLLGHGLVASNDSFAYSFNYSTYQLNVHTFTKSVLSSATSVTGFGILIGLVGNSIMYPTSGSDYTYAVRPNDSASWSTMVATTGITRTRTGINGAMFTNGTDIAYADPDASASLGVIYMNQVASYTPTITASSGAFTGNSISACTSITGGIEAYSYVWSDSIYITSSSRTNLAPNVIYTLTIKDKWENTKLFTYNPPVISVTSTVTNNTAYNGITGQISISAISGGTSPYTYNWSDILTSSSWATGDAAISRTGLYAGDYIFNVTDSFGQALVSKITVKGVPTTQTQLSTSTKPSGAIGGFQNVEKEMDMCGRIMVIVPIVKSNTMSSLLTDVIVYLKTGTAWTLYGSTLSTPTAPADTGNIYVYGVATNGRSIVVLVSATSNVTTETTSTTVLKKIYIYNVWGTTIVYALTIPIYASGTTTYVYSMSGCISYRDNTICVGVRQNSGEGIKAFVCKNSSTGWYADVNASITIPQSDTTDASYCVTTAVGSDNYIFLASPYATGTYTNGGQLTAAYYDGFSWVTDSTITGASASARLGLQLVASGDSFAYLTNNVFNQMHVRTFTKGTLSSATSITVNDYTIGMSDNTLVYATSSSTYAYAVRANDTTSWSAAVVTSGITMYRTQYAGAIFTNGVDIVYADPTANSSMGSIYTNKVSSYTPTITAARGAYVNTSISACPSVSGGIREYTYKWSDTTEITTSSRTSLMPGTSLTLTVKDVFENSATISYDSTVLTLTTTDNTVYGAFAGAISISSITGGIAPYMCSWGDLAGSDIPWAAGCPAITRSALQTGDYLFTVIDSIGVTCTTRISVMGVPFTVPTTIFTGTFGNQPGAVTTATTGADLYDKLLVVCGMNASTLRWPTLQYTSVMVKQGDTWIPTTNNPDVSVDPTNFVYGFATNGTKIAVLVCSSNTTTTQGTTYVKQLHIFSVSGTTVSYTTTVPLYAFGTTYVYQVSDKMSFRGNTICCVVQPTVNDILYAYVCTYSNGTWTGTIMRSIYFPLSNKTSIVTNSWTAVGNDDFIYMGNSGLNNLANVGAVGQAIVAQRNGSNWVMTNTSTDLQGVTANDGFGSYISAYGNTFICQKSGTVARVHIMVGGTIASYLDYTMGSGGNHQFSLCNNSLTFPLSVKTTYLYVVRKSDASAWSVSSSATIARTCSSNQGGVLSNGLDIISTDPNAGGNNGTFKSSPIVTTTLVTPVYTRGKFANGVITAPLVSRGFLNYNYSWADGAATTSTRTGVSQASTYTATAKDVFDNAVSAVYTALTLTSSVTPNTAFNGAAGVISITNISGGTAGYTCSWSDIAGPSTFWFAGSSAITRSSLRAGDYTFTVTDNTGITLTTRFTVKGVPGSVSTLYTGEVSGAALGSKGTSGCGVDMSGRVMVACPIGSTTTRVSYLADVKVFLKTGATWTKSSTTLASSPADTSNYVWGVATNGTMIAVLVCADASTATQNASSVKQIHIFSVSGDTITFSSTIPIYALGSTTTYVYGMSDKIAFRGSTICMGVRSLSTDSICAFLCRYYVGAWSYGPCTSLSIPQTTVSTTISATWSAVGNDSYIYISNSEVASGAGQVLMAFYTGSAAWATALVTGGAYLTAFNDSVAFMSGGGTLQVCVFTNGALASTLDVADTVGSQFALYANTLVQVTSSSTYRYSTRKSDTDVWSSMVSTDAIALTTTSVLGGIYTNGTDIVYGDPSASSNNGALYLWQTTTAVPTIVVAFGVYAAGSFGAPTSVSGGFGEYTFTWSDDASITTSTRSNVAASTTYTLTAKDMWNNSTSVAYITTPIVISTWSTTNNTPVDLTSGTISVSGFSGGTPPYTASWGDDTTILSVGASAITRSLLRSGDYLFTITDSIGSTASMRFTITGVIGSTTTLCSGLATLGYLGMWTSNVMNSIDLYGRVFVAVPSGLTASRSSKVADVVVCTKTGNTWTTQRGLVTNPVDTTNFVVAVGTNGSKIAIFTHGTASTSTQGTANAKKIYIFTVSGNTVTYSATIPLYSDGVSTYMYGSGGTMSFRENTICVPVRPISTDSIYPCICTYKNGVWSSSVVKTIAMSLCTSSTTIVTSMCAVGSDSYVYISNTAITNAGGNTNAGQVACGYYSGTSWTSNSTIIGAAASDFYGRYMVATGDTFAFLTGTGSNIRLYTYTKGTLGTAINTTCYTLGSFALCNNTFVYMTSLTQYSYAIRKSDKDAWTSLSTTTALARNNTNSTYIGAMLTNGFDIMHSNPFASSQSLGSVYVAKIHSSSAAALVATGGDFSGGAITVPIVTGGTTSYTYAWADNAALTAATRSSLMGSSYTLTVKDLWENAATVNYATSASTAPTVSSFSNTAVTASRATFSVTLSALGSGVNSIRIYCGSFYTAISKVTSAQTGIVVTGLTASTGYTASVQYDFTSATGSFTTVGSTVSITTTAAFAFTLTPGTVTNATGYNGSNGAIAATTATAGGSYTYSWSDGSVTTASRTSLAPGSYTITVNEADGNTATHTYTVSYTISATAGAVVNVTTTGASDGTAAAPIVTGAFGSLTYSWSDGSVTTSTRTGLSAGNYTATITDANGISTSVGYTVGTKPSVNLTPGAVTKATSYNGATGSIAVTTVSGGGSYAFSWSDGSSTATSRSALVPGTYTLTVTEAQGNSAQYAFVVSYTISATAGTVVNVTTSGATDGTIGAPTVTGALAPIGYSWNDGSIMTATRTGLAVGSYTLTITDANGISTSVDYTIGTRPSVTLTPGSVTNCTVYTSSNGSIATTSVAGGGSYTYTWSDNGSIFTSSRSSLAVGYYTLTVTEAQGNTASHQFTVTSPITLTAGTITGITATGQTNGSIGLATISGGFTPYTYTYSWGDSGVTTSNRTSLAAGDYTLTVTDPIGATVTHTYTIGVKPAVILTPGTVTYATGYNVADGSISITTVSGGGSYTYSWSDGSSTATSRSSLVPGSYTLTVTEIQGNSASTTFIVSYIYSFTPGFVTGVSSAGQYDATITSPTSFGGGKPGFSYIWS